MGTFVAQTLESSSKKAGDFAKKVLVGPELLYILLVSV